MTTSKLIGIIAVLLLFSSCADKKEYLDQTYEGYWAETMWTYKFQDNGQFIFRTEGHYDNSEEKGIYVVADSLILLNPDTDWSMLNGALKPRLKIVTAECIRDFDNNFYCLTIDSIETKNEPEFEFQSRVIGLIDTLDVVIREKYRLTQVLTTNEVDFSIHYGGIVVVDNVEFHQFDLVQEDGVQWLYRLKFLVKKRPLEIYQHHSAGDSLSLLAKVATI